MLYKTNFYEFCKKLTALKVGEAFDFATSADEDDDDGKIPPNSGESWYGATRLNLFDCDRIIIAKYGGNPEYAVTLNGCPSDVHAYLWDDMREVFKGIFQLNKFSEDLCVYIECKSDTELITEILRKYGWRVQNAIEGLEISDGTYTIGSILKPTPDEYEGTDFFAFSSDKNTDGHFVTFSCGYPEDYKIREAVRAAFDDERRYRDD
ncbi:hypothetical protein FACS1894208_00640 [Clostridia bacterium]|nr:hypothetical protein FACS1894208_00640 [Clostridia bacterium]